MPVFQNFGTSLVWIILAKFRTVDLIFKETIFSLLKKKSSTCVFIGLNNLFIHVPHL